jgi:type IV pilus assembly protein PilQ
VIAPANVTVTPTTVTTTSDVFAPATKGPDQVQQVTTTAPALQVSFPSGPGNATIQYPTTPVVAAPTTASQTGETISVDFPNEEIRTILRNVADLYELNLVIPENLTGTASVKLRNVTWQQVFEVVLEPVGFTYQMENNIVKIKSRAEMQTEPVETRVFLINSARATDMMTSLSPLVDSAAGGRIQVDNRTNALIITERPSKMNSIQVSIETKFIELSVNNSRDLGVTWNFNNTTLGTTGYAWQYNIAHGLGVLPSSGVFPLLQGGASGPANLNLPIETPNTFTYQAPARAADLAFFNQAQYSAVLQALQANTNARLVSAPTVVTLDNEEISFYFGTTVNFIYPTINNQTGTAVPGDHEEKQVGIKMRVKPQVSNNGFINLTLNPEISRIDPVSDSFPIAGTTEAISYPRIDTRELTDAKVSIKDGYTLGIGGLIDDEDDKTVTSVPILGDIPLIGELFKSTATIVTRNNLIIFVTAKTLSPDGATYRDVIDPNLMLRSDVTADEIPGYYDRSHPGVPGMVRATPDQLQQMEAVQEARNQAELDKQMKAYKAEIKDAKADETSHLGK